jgi:hypothetical protein
MINKYYKDSANFSTIMQKHIYKFAKNNGLRPELAGNGSVEISGHQFIIRPDGSFDIVITTKTNVFFKGKTTFDSTTDCFRILTDPKMMKYFANARRLQDGITDIDPPYAFLYESRTQPSADKKEIGETGPKGPTHANGDAGCPKPWLDEQSISHGSDEGQTGEARIDGKTGPDGETGSGKILPKVLTEILHKRKEIRAKLEVDKSKPQPPVESVGTSVSKPQPPIEIVDLDGNICEPLTLFPLATVVFQKQHGKPNPPFKEVIVKTDRYFDMTYADPVHTKLSCMGVFKAQLLTDGTLALYHRYMGLDNKFRRIRFVPGTLYTDLGDSTEKILGQIYN